MLVLETFSSVTNISYVWGIISCTGGTSNLGSWLGGGGIYRLESIVLTLGLFWGILIPVPWNPNISK